MMGQKQTMVLLCEHLGNRAPKADPDLKDPRSTLAIALYKVLDNMTGSALNDLLKVVEGTDSKPGTRTGQLKRARGLMSKLLDVDSEEDVHSPLATWKMWPLVINRKEKKMATNKQATKKKTTSKKASVKKSSVKKSSVKKGTTKKTVTKKKAVAGRKGKLAAAKLLKPLKKGSKRGDVLEKFLGKKTITAEAAASALKTSRSNVLSHLHDLNKYNGIGYELDGDGPVVVTLPKGCKSPWA